MRTVNPTLKKVFYFIEEEGRVMKETVHTFPLSRKSDEDLKNATVFSLVQKRQIHDNV